MHEREAEKLIPEDLVHAATTANFANVGTRYERI